jgi:hypothetical protein
VTGSTPQRDANAELRQHPGWWAELQGEALDLQTLAGSVRLPGVRIEFFDGRYYLVADEFAALPREQSAEVDRRATEIVRVLNGAARVEHGNSREVSVGAVALVGADGQAERIVHASTTGLTIRSRLGAVGGGGQLESARTELDRAAEAGLTSPDAERALRIFGRDDCNYRDLYAVFEIAEAALGKRLYTGSVVTKPEVSRFTRTANHPLALGDAARHGHSNEQPPQNPMPFDQAHELMRRILRMWLAP